MIPLVMAHQCFMRYSGPLKRGPVLVTQFNIGQKVFLEYLTEGLVTNI